MIPNIMPSDAATGGEQKELHQLSYELGRNAKGLEDLTKLFEPVLAVVGTGVMVVVGWMVEAAVKWGVGWVIGTILKVKLGG